MDALNYRTDDASVASVSPEPHFNGRLETAADALRYILSGRATVTFVGRSSRYTFKVSAPSKEGSTAPDHNSQLRFVGLMNGPDNENSYMYMGYIRRGIYFHGNKSKIGRDAPSAVAFQWVYRNLVKGVLPPGLEIWHEGRCGRCGRKLTVPESIASGYGPECINYIGG